MLCNLVDIPDVCVCNRGLCDTTARLGRELADVVCQNEGAESRARMAGIAITQTSIDTDELDPVTWFRPVYQIIVEYNIYAAWQLTSGCSLWHFLYGDRLVVTISAIAILSDELGIVNMSAVDFRITALTGLPSSSSVGYTLVVVAPTVMVWSLYSLLTNLFAISL
jgi:hypothetical protein